MAIRDNKISLGNAVFNPATFQGAVFTPQQENMSLLQHSIDKLDERKEKTDIQKANIAEAFSKIRELLPDNEETNQYITDNQNRIMGSIDSMINLGDYGAALSSARTLASTFMASPEYNARIKEHKQRNVWLESLNRSNVDNYIKEYYIDTYKDKNNFTRDKNGNITGTAGWEAPLPEQGQSATSIIQAAVKATADERTDSSKSWTNTDGTGGHNVYKRELLAAEKISNTAKSIINNDNNIRQAFIDQFNAGIHQISKLEVSLNNTTDERKRQDIQNKIDGYKKAFYKNGAPISNAEMYIEDLFNKDNIEIKNAAYNYIHTNKGTDNSPKSSSGTGGIDLSKYVGGEGEYEGEEGQSTRQTIVDAVNGAKTYVLKGNRQGLQYASWNNKK